MSRTNRSARQAGAKFERSIADYLAAHYGDDRIDRRVKHGAKDRGDIAGMRVHGQPLVIECKNTTRLDLAGWAAEAETERGNDDALAGIVIHKRHGNANPADQWVTMTLGELLAIIDGERIPE